MKLQYAPNGTGIFTYIYHEFKPNVGKYSIHGAYGWMTFSLRNIHRPVGSFGCNFSRCGAKTCEGNCLENWLRSLFSANLENIMYHFFRQLWLVLGVFS